MASRPPDLTIRSLRGGLNTDDPASELKPDQCTVATNVEFHTTPCGERRRGCVSINQGAYANTYTFIPFLIRHLPTNDETAAQLWAVGWNSNASTYDWLYKDTAWHTVTPLNGFGAGGELYVRGVSFHNKLFLAYPGQSRLNVWDGTSHRGAGIYAPTAAPTAVNSGVGTMSGIRYYRVRFTIVNGSGVTLLRSEPSAVVSFTPTGSNHAVVTRPATAASDVPTHWELEASIDNVNFYLAQQRVAIATTTTNDSIPYGEGYNGATSVAGGGGRLSDTSGDYTVPPPAKYLTVDEDRLVMVGDYSNTALGSRVAWTPVNGDPGVGNDERVPISSVNFLDLDAGQGGDATDVSEASNGFFYVFKWKHIYKLVRTGDRSQAYQASVVSKTMGALPGSVVSGLDEFGRSCVYALDPSLGIYRIGANGLQTHHGLGSKVNDRSTWSIVNTDATIPAIAVYYADAKQIQWWVATGSNNYPNLKITLQTDATRATDIGIEGGVSLADSTMANAVSVCMFAENIDAGVARTRVLKPFIGTVGALGTTTNATIRRCDTGTTDDGANYEATLTTAPIMSAGQLNRFGTLSAGIIAMPANGVTITLAQERNFSGVEDRISHIDLTPAASETEVIKTADNSGLTDIQALQVTLADYNFGGRWEVVQIALSQSVQEKG